VRAIIRKLAEKVKRSTALLRSQHIGRALLGLQRFGSGTPEVRSAIVMGTENCYYIEMYTAIALSSNALVSH
jgi:hypothetical protein